MSDAKPPATSHVEESAATHTVPKPKAKSGFSNPALQMMGIPRIKLPSRNWMIFWSALAFFGGGAAYTKYHQRQMRTEYMERVSKLGEEPMALNVTARKLTVFIAPPPSDFLEESLKVFRKYVKPILNAAAIDFEIVSEQRQGEIRYKVAEDIRNLRRKYKDELESIKEPQKSEETEFVRPSSVYHWSDNTKSASRLKIFDEDGSMVETKLSTSLNTLSLLGVNYRSNLQKDFPDLKTEDVLCETPEQAGGVICIGRGAYKEYLTGLHEGLLGPLEAPVVPKEEPKLTEEVEDSTKTEEDREEEEHQKRIPLPYIKPSEYGKYAIAPELDLNTQLFFGPNRPAYFQQPILVLRSFNLVGFLKIPERVYRFYTGARQAEYYHSSTLAVVEKKYRRFDKQKDVSLAAEEEADWPTKWVNKGKERDSLWVSTLHCDDRVAEHLYVYDDK